MTVYISIDVETSGPSPVSNSLLSIGAVADLDVANDFSDLQRIGEFEVNIWNTLTNWDPGTREFWDKNPEALEITTRDQRMPAVAAHRFMNWIEEMQDVAVAQRTQAGRESVKTHQLPHSDVCFVAYPAVFDMDWIRHLLFTHVPKRFNALGWGSFSGLDLMTMMSVISGKPPFLTGGKNWYGPWSEVMQPFYTPKHVAINDARAQAALFKHLLGAMKEVRDGYIFNLVRMGPPAGGPAEITWYEGEDNGAPSVTITANED